LRYVVKHGVESGVFVGVEFGVSFGVEFGVKGVGMVRAEIGLKNRQIINQTYSFSCFLIL
jgi:hypothetical protein